MRNTLLFVLLIAPCLLQAGSLTGRVAHVDNGNTLVVVDRNHAQHKVRLLGIAAPTREQPYGGASKARLADTVAGRFVVVNYRKRDRYERILGKVLLSNQDINLEQIRAGLAWHYPEHQREQSRADLEKYANAEREARLNRRGLWTGRDPVSPWVHRKMKREKLRNSRPIMDAPGAK